VATVVYGASPHEGNPGNECQGGSCVPLDDLAPPAQACDTPAAIMNPHCKPGVGGPGVDDDPEPEQPARPLRRGARMPAAQALPVAVCPSEFGDVVRGATTSAQVWQQVASTLAGQTWVPVRVEDGKIAGVTDQSDWVVVEALGDGTVCALFIGGVSG
jgi:hypothetical protein